MNEWSLIQFADVPEAVALDIRVSLLVCACGLLHRYSSIAAMHVLCPAIMLDFTSFVPVQEFQQRVSPRSSRCGLTFLQTSPHIYVPICIA